jgi:hypothetical protein
MSIALTLNAFPGGSESEEPIEEMEGMEESLASQQSSEDAGLIDPLQDTGIVKNPS